MPMQPDPALQTLFHAVSGLLSSLDYGALWPGFHQFPFALYTDEWVYLADEAIPWDERFLGNTAIPWEGGALAIWRIENPDAESPARLAASMAHEMFHAYQNEQGETRFPDDFTLFSYPDDLSHYTRKHQETQLLADAVLTGDRAALARFSAIRMERYARYPAAVWAEMMAETAEGLTQLIEYRAARQMDPSLFEALQSFSIGALHATGEAFFSTRSFSYNTGCCLGLALEAAGIPFEHPLAGETVPLFLRIRPTLPPAGTIPPLTNSPLQSAYAAYATAKQERFDAFFASATLEHAAACSIVGYDPMNTYRLGDMLLCTHFVALRIEGNSSSTLLMEPVVLRLRPGSLCEVVAYITHGLVSC